MSTRTKWTAVIVAGTIVAILFSARGPLGGFWGLEEVETDPAGGALAALVTAQLVEFIAFGVGVAWIAFGWPVVRRVSRPLALPAFVAIAWALVSWAPHTSFHMSVADGNWAGLAAIEWGFHVTLVIGALIVAAFMWRALRGADTMSPDTSAAVASAAA